MTYISKSKSTFINQKRIDMAKNNSIRFILASNKLRAKKHMGQNFLNSKEIRNKIANNLVLSNNDIVLEIGAGLGAITIPIAKIAKKIFAIEKDPNLLEVLNEIVISSNIKNVKLILGDVLKINFYDIYAIAKKKLILVGNLPYNISSQVLIKTIENRGICKKAVFMLQKEVADRIVSKPGSKNYGRLSVMLQYYAKIRTLFTLKSSMFFPKPKIDSTLLEFYFFQKPKFIAKDETLLSSVVKAAFSKRRKTLKNSLVSENINAKMCTKILNKAGIDPTRRAETISVKEFVLLSNCFYSSNLSYINTINLN